MTADQIIRRALRTAYETGAEVEVLVNGNAGKQVQAGRITRIDQSTVRVEGVVGAYRIEEIGRVTFSR